jgi:uncharacterized protein with PhoU and TrkA domain
MRRLFLIPLIPIAALAACSPAEPENVQARAQNESIRLEERYNQIQAEAENDTADAAAPVENEAEALLNQLNVVAANESTADAVTNAH